MFLNEDIAKIASLIGDKARSTMLMALMDGKALTAGELAFRANISPQTASNHLAKLMQARLIICESAGRHRYYKIASNNVAAALESLSVLTPSLKKKFFVQNKLDKDICFARTCYDHLAGELGVKITNTLLINEIINKQNDIFTVTNKGKKFFKKINIDVSILIKQRRQFAKACLDWTEREHHIAGALGKALLDYFLDNRLLIQSKTKSRVVILTTKGTGWLKNEFNEIQI